LRTLYLVRHAKSSWSDPTLADHERPLSARGRRAARKMGRRLARRDLCPDLMLSSPAVRALKTARLLARRLCYARRDIIVDATLYACSSADLLRTVRSLDERFPQVMLIGHNPELTGLAHRFCKQITHMPTCAVARFTFDAVTWTDITRQPPVEVEFDYPKRPST